MVKEMSNKIDITNFKGDANDLARHINEQIEDEDDIPIRVDKEVVRGMPQFCELLGKLIVDGYKVVRTQDKIWLYHEKGQITDISWVERKAGYCLHIMRNLKRKIR